jgi:hypothetical protein
MVFCLLQRNQNHLKGQCPLLLDPSNLCHSLLDCHHFAQCHHFGTLLGCSGHLLSLFVSFKLRFFPLMQGRPPRQSEFPHKEIRFLGIQKRIASRNWLRNDCLMTDLRVMIKLIFYCSKDVDIFMNERKLRKCLK